VFASEWLTGAMFDRLTHHAHILENNGDSYRGLAKNTPKLHTLFALANTWMVRHRLLATG
jgi:IS5 family transposase